MIIRKVTYDHSQGHIWSFTRSYAIVYKVIYDHSQGYIRTFTRSYTIILKVIYDHSQGYIYDHSHTINIDKYIMTDSISILYLLVYCLCIGIVQLLPLLLLCQTHLLKTGTWKLCSALSHTALIQITQQRKLGYDQATESTGGVSGQFKNAGTLTW